MTEQQTVKATPGPWVAQFHVMATPGGAHCISPVDGALSDVAWVNPDTPEHEANARLIAAAPELLEALQALEDAAHAAMDDTLPVSVKNRAANHAIELRRAAIAKAMGAL